MKIYSVWIEGYAATGESGTAIFLGNHMASSFKDAVELALFENKWDMKGYYDAERLTYWGCKFYDNEQDARKHFG